MMRIFYYLCLVFLGLLSSCVCGVGSVSMEENKLGDKVYNLSGSAYAFFDEMMGYTTGGKTCQLTKGDISKARSSSCREGRASCTSARDCSAQCNPMSAGTCKYNGNEDLPANCKSNMPSCMGSATSCWYSCGRTGKESDWECKSDSSLEWDCKENPAGVKKKDPKSLILILSVTVFSPTRDPRFMPMNETLEWLRKISVSPGLGVTIINAKELSAGATFEYKKGSDVKSDPKNPPKISYAFWAGQEEVSREDTYPEKKIRPGRKSTFTLEITNVGSKAGERIEGKYTLTIEKDPKYDDPKISTNKIYDIVSGTLKGNFSALLIQERIAKCYSSQLVTWYRGYSIPREASCQMFSGQIP